MAIDTFSKAVLDWYDIHGRKNLPWQHPRTAYRVWLSEIMLQQTQVKTVIPYFNQFIQSFPNIWVLAQASDDQVLAHWSGLGYYSRARNLIKTAKIICESYQGEFPANLTALCALPGIGATTAAAITSQAFNQANAILDGNVKRVLSRYFLVGGNQDEAAVKKKLWQYAQVCMPLTRCADYTQAIMDLGATCCTSKKPNCSSCPLQKNCLAYLKDLVHDYPQKKKRKVLPIKSQQFLVLYREDQRVFLTKKPPTGIWGGLWCLPHLDIDDCPKTYINKQFSLASINQQELSSLRHSFSHFHLDIKSLALKIQENKDIQLCEHSGQWFSREELKQLGLPKPVVLILENFFA